MVKSQEEKRAYQREWYVKNRERQRERGRMWYAANREKVIADGRARAKANREERYAYQKRWKKANPDKHRALNRRHWLKKFYGLTEDQWDAMFEAQGRVCACCGSDEPKGVNGWNTDHCHNTKRVRGILCHPCNVILGLAKDNPKTLERGAAYLRASKLSEI